jgi:hypothetical protein
MWIESLLDAATKIKAIASCIGTVTQPHPELKGELDEAFTLVLNALRHRDVSAIVSLVHEVEDVFEAFVKAYTGERAAVATLLVQLNMIAN